jgi:hypothetical protein
MSTYNNTVIYLTKSCDGLHLIYLYISYMHTGMEQIKPRVTQCVRKVAVHS